MMAVNKEEMMYRVLIAHTMRGWSGSDHLINDARLDEMVGTTYGRLCDLKRSARSRADQRGFASVEYTDGVRRYLWSDYPYVPGSHNGPTTVDLGPYVAETVWGEQVASRCDLREAYFYEVDLTGADLSGGK